MAKRPAGEGETPDDGSEPTLLYLVGRIDRVVRQAIGGVVKEQGLSVNQYTTLSVLDRRSGLVRDEDGVRERFGVRCARATVLIVLLVLCLLGGGGWGYARWRR